VKAYRKALQLNPEGSRIAGTTLPRFTTRVGKKKKAIRFYLNALKINPSYKLAYYNLGNIFEEIPENSGLAVKCT